MVSGYAIQGFADALDKRDQNILIQKKLDLEEQDRKDAKNSKVMDFLNRVGAGYKNSNDSKNTSKKKAEVLLRLRNSFGENSEIYASLLAGGSLENLQNAEKIVNEAREKVESVGGTFTEQDAKESFDIFLTEVVKNENQITAEQLAERFGVDPDAELPGTGMSFEEAFQNYVDDLNQDTYLFGMRGKTPITEYELPRELEEYDFGPQPIKGVAQTQVPSMLGTIAGAAAKGATVMANNYSGTDTGGYGNNNYGGTTSINYPTGTTTWTYDPNN